MARIANREITRAVASGETFTANSTTGGFSSTFTYLGRLPSEWRELAQEHERAGLVEYVVLSYGTPIAWVLTDGTAVVPAVKYSVTTSKAQGYVRAGLLRRAPVVEQIPA